MIGYELKLQLEQSPLIDVLGQGYNVYCWGFVNEITGEMSHYEVYAVSLDFALSQIVQYHSGTDFSSQRIDATTYSLYSSAYNGYSMYLFAAI